MAGRRPHGDGALFERKSGRHKGKWVARIQLPADESGVSKRVDYQFSTQAAALGKLQSVIHEVKRGRAPITKSRKLGDYLDEWLESRVRPNRSPNTYERYRSAIVVHIKPDPISKLDLAAIRVGHVHDLLGRRAKDEAKPATLFNIRATLSAAMQQAVRDERIHENPVRKSESPRQLDKDIRFLTPKESKTLIEASNGSDFGVLILAAIYTGMRMSELIGLTWDRVDFERNTITVDRQLQRHNRAFYLAPLKTRGGRRTIPMSSSLIEKLKAMKGGALLAPVSEFSSVPDLVFLNSSGQPHHRKTVLKTVNQTMRAANVPMVGFHALRHTCASILINAGADALRVQRQLGHSSVRMTLETYSHLFEERLQGNVDLIDKALS